MRPRQSQHLGFHLDSPKLKVEIRSSSILIILGQSFLTRIHIIDLLLPAPQLRLSLRHRMLRLMKRDDVLVWPVFKPHLPDQSILQVDLPPTLLRHTPEQWLSRGDIGMTPTLMLQHQSTIEVENLRQCRLHLPRPRLRLR